MSADQSAGPSPASCHLIVLGGGQEGQPESLGSEIWRDLLGFTARESVMVVIATSRHTLFSGLDSLAVLLRHLCLLPAFAILTLLSVLVVVGRRRPFSLRPQRAPCSLFCYFRISGAAHFTSMASSPGPMTIRDTFGALFIGALIAMSTYGITTLQAYFYYISFPKDGIATKLLVASIWILDTVHVIFMCHALHFYLIVHFGNNEALTNGTWSLFSSIGLNVLVSFVAQCFFTERIFKLCPPRKRWWVTGIIGLTVIAHFFFGIETVVFLFIKKEFRRLKEVSLIAAVPFGIVAVLSDIFIAVALCVLLGSNRSTFEDTNSLINKLIIFAINRCILTSAVAVAETIVFSLLSNSFYSVAMDFVIGKLYANSLLAVLNSRATLRNSSRAVLDSTELSIRFHASALANHHSQVRTRESTRVSGTDKDSRQEMITTTLEHERSLENLGV